MTAPRQILPGSTYLVTRRIAHQQFLLKPSPLTNDTFGYILAVAASRYGILLHDFMVLSNHYHLVLTDPLAQLPAFSQYLDSLVARALNASLGRWEHFWAPSSYSAVRLETPDDIVEKAAYTLANPVAAGLVATHKEWPGLWSDPDRADAGKREFVRPEHFFSKTGFMPERASLALVPPPGFTQEEYRRRVDARVAELEAEAARKLRAQGRGFAGARKVLAQRPTDRPRGEEVRRGLNPRVAARDKWKRIEALARLSTFLLEYRDALKRLRGGAKDVVFPFGTYQLRVHLRVACAGAG